MEDKGIDILLSQPSLVLCYTFTQVLYLLEVYHVLLKTGEKHIAGKALY